MKEAQPIAEAGSHSLEASQATRRSAADGGEATRTAQTADQPFAHAGTNGASAESEATLAAEDADRFAMAFRPSWEPVAPPPGAAPGVKYRSFAPSFAPKPPAAVHDASGMLQDDLLHLRAARVRSRSLALAAVSILSFGALVYWGISSTTDGAEHSATRALQLPQPDDRAAEEPVASPPRAPLPEPTRLTARLADPTAPAAPRAAPEGEQAEGNADGQAANTATEPAPSEAKPLAAAPAAATPTQANDPATVTDIKPATAAAEAHPATETKMAPASAAPLAAATEQAMPKPSTVQPVGHASSEAAPTAKAPADARPESNAVAAATPKPVAPAVTAKPAAHSSDPAAAAPKPTAPALTAKPAAPSDPAAAAPKPAAPSSELAAAAPKPAAPSSAAAAAAPKPAAPAVPAKPAGELAAAAPRTAAEASSAAKAESAEAAKSRAPLLEVRAVPDSAQLFLDGQRMANPFDTRLPQGSKHKLDARQDGYETSSQSIRLESDAKLTITLKRATPAPEPHLKVKPLPEGANGAGFVTSNPY